MTLEKFIQVQKTKKIIKYSLFLCIFVLYFFYLNISFYDFIDGLKKLMYIFKSMLRIDFTDYKIVMIKMFETFIVAFSSSFFGVFLSIIFAPLLTKHFIKNRIVLKFLNSIFSFFRTIPALVFAAILVSILSTGSFTGFISLLIITFFSSSKLLREYIDELDVAKIKHFKSLGFSNFTLLRACILPTSKSYIISIFFLSLESSMRGASVLGMVGAGGIGEELWKNLNYLRYDKVSFIILILLFFIFITDSISYFFRKRDIIFNISSYREYKNLKVLKLVFLFSLIFFSIYFLKGLYQEIESLDLKIVLKKLFIFLMKIRNLDFNYLRKGILALFESFNLAFFATFLSIPSSIIIAYFGSSNISNSKISFFIKFIINLLRTFPPVIVAIIFFSGFGPRFISGFFALCLYTTGVVSKIYIDMLESSEIDYGIYAKSLGLSKLTAYLKFWLPSTFTNFVSVILYRFESNMKNSSILGMVGAGGIGQLLINHIGFRNWEKVWILILILVVTIIIIEIISDFIREKIKI